VVLQVSLIRGLGPFLGEVGSAFNKTVCEQMNKRVDKNRAKGEKKKNWGNERKRERGKVLHTLFLRTPCQWMIGSGEWLSKSIVQALS
jgi:hypothetical protein